MILLDLHAFYGVQCLQASLGVQLLVALDDYRRATRSKKNILKLLTVKKLPLCLL